MTPDERIARLSGSRWKGVEMTPDERIAQLTAERAGGVAIPPRPPVAVSDRQTTETIQADSISLKALPLLSRYLPESWREISDDYRSRNRRTRAIDHETRIAAWAVSRCLGDDWNYQRDSQGSRYRIIHKDGYGVTFGRSWRDTGRFTVHPIRRHRTDDGLPSEITISASRTFGSIARDILNRMVSSGLKKAHDDDVDYIESQKAELRERFSAMSAVCRAVGGRIRDKRYWKSSGYPEAEIPGGRAGWGYGDQVNFELSMPPAMAVRVAELLATLKSETL